MFIADSANSRIRRVAPSLPGFSTTDLGIASEDGRHLYLFDPEGRHLSTVDTLTKAVVYRFAYDSAGRLTSITDADHNVTTIERDASGHPTALVAPFGQRTTLSVDGDGSLARVVNPAGEAYQLTTTADGLLTAFTDPNGHTGRTSPTTPSAGCNATPTPAVAVKPWPASNSPAATPSPAAPR